MQTHKQYVTHIMADTTNNISDKKLRLTIRICKDNMAFSVGDPQESGQLVYEPYHMNAGISIAANLREAFHVSELLQSGYKRVLIELDAPVMLVPTDEYAGQDVEALYHHTYHQNGSEEILSSVLPDLNAIAVFSINKDLKLVIDDHFQDIRIQPLMQSVWTHCYRRSFSGTRRKLYAYFHEKQLEVFCFQQNRFRFSNSFVTTHAHDILYYLLYIWKLTGMEAEKDELYLLGSMPHEDWLTTQIKQHLQYCRVISPETDFNNNSIAKQKNIPYDMKAIYLD